MRSEKPAGRPQHRDEGWLSRERMAAFALLAATLLGIYLCFRLAEPFLPALTWALTLAVAGDPLHRWIAHRIGRPGVAAGITATVLFFVVVAPAVWVTQQISVQVAEGFTALKERTGSNDWGAILEANPWLAGTVSRITESFNLAAELERALKAVVGRFTGLVSGVFGVGVQLLVTFFLLFYFFRDRERALATVRALVPLSDREANTALARVADIVHATVFGTVLVAIVQGTLGGLIFWWLGLPAPLVWGAVMAVLAVLPVLGAALVWVPAAIFLALQGSLGKAAILAAWGGIVVALIDNLLYPLFVGKKVRMHTVPVFLALVGGLAFFGAPGIVLGPVILAVTVVLLEVWRSRTAGGGKADAEES
jgi:predicted PurR-regulated permease PerM